MYDRVNSEAEQDNDIGLNARDGRLVAHVFVSFGKSILLKDVSVRYFLVSRLLNIESTDEGIRGILRPPHLFYKSPSSHNTDYACARLPLAGLML